ncbi:MAG: ABC transporter permease [Phycisphaerae bacterium]|nr:ABC transporter permease [Phycisphaerae bacterium]
MRHWSRLATRNWRVKRVRTAGAVLAIALGTGAVVWVTCCYESVRESVEKWAGTYVGASHINIESAWGKYDTLPQRLLTKIEGLRDGKNGKRIENIKYVTPLLVQRLKAVTVKRANLEAATETPRRWSPTMDDLDVYGIDLRREFDIRDWNEMLVAGRMITTADEFACVLEVAVAEEEQIGVGDSILIWRSGEPGDKPVALEIVGLIQRRRIARFIKGVALVRLPVLQQICLKHALVNAIDIVLHEYDRNSLRLTAARIHVAVRSIAPHAQVRSAALRQAQLKAAQDQQQMVLVLMSCVAMLTALFIILSTLSMGMIERITQMGLLRCVGMTRGQLAWLTLVEVFPLGVLGIIFGVPIGLGLTKLSVWLVPDYVGTYMVSQNGILLAVIAGLATTFVAGLLPAFAAATVSPLEATRPRARSAGLWVLLVVFVLAVTTLAVQVYIVSHWVRRDVEFGQWSALSVVLLYIVYALAAPLLVWVVSRLAVPIVALLVGVRLRLLQDQVGRAVWRSAGIVCGLMVGLSLIVSLVTFDASFRSGWQFPKEFPEAYLWSFDQMKGDVAGAVAATPGVKSYTAANAPNVIVEERPVLGEDLVRSFTYFLGVEPDSFFDLIKLKFLEGDVDTTRVLLKRHCDGDEELARTILKDYFNVDEEAARAAWEQSSDHFPPSPLKDRHRKFAAGEEGAAAKLLNALLKKEQFVLVAADFARARRKGVAVVQDKDGNVLISNQVRIWFNARWTTFRVAGVIDSPALDIAASYFQVQSEARVAATGSVVGANADLKRLYGLDGTKLILLNFDLSPEPPPADWPPPRASPEGAWMPSKYYNEEETLERRWQNYREEFHVLNELRKKLDAPQIFYGTARELKDEIDSELKKMTYLLTAVPAVALLVAAIGVANLMTANVASRTKQVAVMRAVGATRGLVLRLVIGEALVLGVLGSGLGLGLGTHLAWNITIMTERMWGYQLAMAVPWDLVGAAVALTVGLCILAGIAPARHASRTNIIDALHVA